jgi:hypothetical protein
MAEPVGFSSSVEPDSGVEVMRVMGKKSLSDLAE